MEKKEEKYFYNSSQFWRALEKHIPTDLELASAFQFCF